MQMRILFVYIKIVKKKNVKLMNARCVWKINKNAKSVKMDFIYKMDSANKQINQKIVKN